MELLLDRMEILDLGENLHSFSITCRTGRCWITQAGDNRDHILGVGDRFMVNTSGKLIITATESCRLLLNETGVQCQPQWLAKILYGVFKGDRRERSKSKTIFR